jgi:hypothetical protein
MFQNYHTGFLIALAARETAGAINIFIGIELKSWIFGKSC